MTSSFDIKLISTGAIIGIVGVLVMIFVPLAAFPIILISLAPTIYLSYYRDPIHSITASLITCAAMSFVFHAALPTSLFIAACVPGTIIGTVAKKKLSFGDVMKIAVLACIVCDVVSTFIFTSWTGESIAPTAEQIDLFFASLDPSQVSVIGEDAITALKQSVAYSLEYMRLLLPAEMIFFAASASILSLKLASFVFKKNHGAPMIAIPRFRDLKFPKSTLIVVLFAFICSVVSDGAPNSFIGQMGVNFDAVSMVLFAIEGLAVASFFMARKGVPVIIRAIVVILTPFIAIMSTIFMTVGVLDIGFGLREIAAEKGRRS